MINETHIWIVEDDARLASVMQEYLTLEGFQTRHFSNGKNLLLAMESNIPDLLLLDVMMPGIDGLSLCGEIRKSNNLPIMFVTSKNSESDRIIGFELGADDYLCKPFNLKEMVYRVKALLKRTMPSTSTKPTNNIVYGAITLDLISHRVVIENSELHLTPTEFDLLKLFMNSPNVAFSRAMLVEQAIGYGYQGYDRSADFHIKNLRRKLETKLPAEKYIKTVRGIGFRFV
ncbi:response regulator transcription factor [Shewanella sp. TC10]|uniref:response regulator transcription factor n=1 Tax=Shewanella sp. TC10 TaxID=1419739 RepID=UPI00129DB231|nr:response regulator transcription factor [Shewanella sp. TC10]